MDGAAAPPPGLAGQAGQPLAGQLAKPEGGFDPGATRFAAVVGRESQLEAALGDGEREVGGVEVGSCVVHELSYELIQERTQASCFMKKHQPVK